MSQKPGPLPPIINLPRQVDCNECDTNAHMGNTGKIWPILPCVWPTANEKLYNPTCKKGETKVVLRCERLPWYGWPNALKTNLQPLYPGEMCQSEKCPPELPCCKVYVCKKTYINKVARSKSLNDITEYSKITQEANPDFNFDFDLEIIAYIASLKSINNFSI